jgi:hypothetical protein
MKLNVMKKGKSYTLIILLIAFVFFGGTAGTDSKSGIYEPPCCNGTWYEPPGTVLSEVMLNRPSAGNSVVDTTFDTTITALPGGTRNTYSQLQVWSSDNRYMITVDPDDGYQVRDADTFAVLRQITHSSPRWIPRTHKVITVDNEPGRIFTYDVDSGKEDVLIGLPQYQYITSSVSFEELSRDGQWMSLYIANDGSGNVRLLTVNLFEKRIAMNRRLQDMCAPDPVWGLLEPDWVGVSPNGNYAVIQWARDGTTLCSGLELYDIETGEFVRRIHTHHSHSDLGLAADGREILVSFELAHPDNTNYPAIVLYWLDGSPKKYLRMVPWFRLDHVSCQGPAGAWLVTAGNDEGDPLLKGELYIVYQDGSLRRIAHHRSDSCDYWSQPKATISVDGTRVAFSSDWRGNCSQAGGFVIHNLNLVEASATGHAITLNRSALTFGAVPGVNSTSPQSFLIGSNGAGALNWNLSTSASWLSASPGSGTGSAEITVSVNPSGLVSGTYSGTITVTDPNASNSPQIVSVTLNVYASGQDSAPFGSIDTPVHGSTARSSIPVSGWALDDIAVERVKIYRMEGTHQIYIGDAVFVEGARPDVESAYPGYPNNYKAGWGYMLLTNFLPNGGNGVFDIKATAIDTGGRQVTLGTKTITCDNANAVKPFGAIDNPLQGGTASGSSFINWGWVLTPQPNKIPTHGSTINVWIDGVNIGHPVYNIYRSDIANLFPSYANSNGAIGYFYLDTTAYENGVHTIQWTATDNAGNTDGIGSRYFSIQNNSQRVRSMIQNITGRGNSPWLPISGGTISVDYSRPIRVKKGYNNTEPMTIYPDASGTITIEIKEMERLEIHFLHPGQSALNISPLPIGSTFDSGRGIFYWQPGVGYIGRYRLVFTEIDDFGNQTRKRVEVFIRPKY